MRPALRGSQCSVTQQRVIAMSPIERPCITNEPMGLPSPEALRLATAVIRRRYALPETMDHPQVRSECMRLAYMIMAYGLAPPPADADHQTSNATIRLTHCLPASGEEYLEKA